MPNQVGDDGEKQLGPNKRVVALSSGTAEVHLALIACGAGPGDEVLVQSFTFYTSPENNIKGLPPMVDNPLRGWVNRIPG